MESYLTDPRHDETQSPEERDASEPKFEAGRDTVEGTPLNPALVSETPSAEGLLYSPVTSEEFFAEGTSPLADTTTVPAKYAPITVERFSEGLYTQREPVKADSEPKKYTTSFDAGIKNRLYLERKPAVIDGDRTQLTKTQIGAVVEEVLDQTLTRYEINGVEVPKYFADESTERANQICYLAKKVIELEDFNKKLLTALKHLGFDTVKLFR